MTLIRLVRRVAKGPCGRLAHPMEQRRHLSRHPQQPAGVPLSEGQMALVELLERPAGRQLDG